MGKARLFYFAAILLTNFEFSLAHFLPPDLISAALDEQQQIQQSHPAEPQLPQEGPNINTLDPKITSPDIEILNQMSENPGISQARIDDDSLCEDCDCECEDETAEPEIHAKPVTANSTPDRSVLLVYHPQMEEEKGAVKFHGNELLVAVNTIHRSVSSLPIHLFTNMSPKWLKDKVLVGSEVEPNITRFISGQEKISIEHDSTLLLAEALLSGWEKQILGRNVLVMDVNSIVSSSSDELLSLENIFAVHDSYQLAGCFESVDSKHWMTVHKGLPWILNTDVLLARQESRALLREWLEVMQQRRHDHYALPAHSRGQPHGIIQDRIDLMHLLEMRPEIRVFPLPTVFNFQRSTVWGISRHSHPVVVHSKVYRDARLKPANSEAVLKSTAIVIMEDCLYNLKQSGLHIKSMCPNLLEEEP